MNFDLGRSLRRLRPQRTAPPLTRRAERDLVFIDPGRSIGRDLLLDSTVYIDTLQGRSPPEVDALLRRSLSHHSAVAVGELTQAFGRLDPKDPRTRGALDKLATALSSIPPRRLEAPSVRAFAEAGMLAGLGARLGAAETGPALLNDALLLLQARETGRTLLTRNLRDFDVLQQLVPDAQVAFYRRRDPPVGEPG